MRVYLDAMITKFRNRYFIRSYYFEIKKPQFELTELIKKSQYITKFCSVPEGATGSSTGGGSSLVLFIFHFTHEAIIGGSVLVMKIIAYKIKLHSR